MIAIVTQQLYHKIQLKHLLYHFVSTVSECMFYRKEVKRFTLYSSTFTSSEGMSSTGSLLGPWNRNINNFLCT